MNIINTIKMVAANVAKYVVKESPTILTALGVTGVVSTVGLAIVGTTKAIPMIEKEKYERQDPAPLPPLDVVKLVWKCYIPTTAMGAATISCIIGANAISRGRNAALASLYLLTKDTMKEYQDKVVEMVGKNKELKIRDEIAGDRLKKNPVENNNVIITGAGDVLFYDSLSGRYFKSDMESIRKNVNDFNAELIDEMYKTLNDFYYILGLEPVEMGKDAGWVADRGSLLDINFSSKIATNGVPCIVLDYKVYPKSL